MLQRLVLCVPLLHGWQGSCMGAADPRNFARRGHEANASRGARTHAEAPGRRHQQHPKPATGTISTCWINPGGSVPGRSPKTPPKNESRRKIGQFLEIWKVGQKWVKSRSTIGFRANKPIFDLLLTYFWRTFRISGEPTFDLCFACFV